MFGMDAALFCPSGTMTNQIAIKCHTQPGNEVICEKNSHVYIYEGGGIAFNSSCQVKPIDGDRGRIKAEQIEPLINPDDIHKPVTALFSVENTSNRGGGSCYEFQDFIDIKSLQIVIDTAREGSRRRDTCNWDHIASHRDTRKDSGLVWTTMPIKAGLYDVLRFRNGLDTLFASANVPKGSVRLVRIELGTNNSVVKDSVSYPLNVSPNLSNFITLKLQGHEFEEFAIIINERTYSFL
jgi:hypothetical protein